jgi:hypothetical protein
LVEKKLSDDEVDLLAVLAMAGVAAEGLKYEEVRVDLAGRPTPLACA